MLLKTGFGQTNRVQCAWLVLFLALLPTMIFLTNAPVWDDALVFHADDSWSWSMLSGPYLSSYWRPLTTLTIVIPNLIGVPVWANKLISVILFFVQGCLALAIVDTYWQPKKSRLHFLPLIVLALLFALHPVFVESTLWIAARADLLLGIIVLLGVIWIMDAYQRQSHALPPQNMAMGLLWGAIITALACASKDTGLVWSGVAFIAVLMLSKRSDSAWRRYWQYAAAGIFIVAALFLLLRNLVLRHAPGIAERHVSSMTARLEIFAEFFLRSLVNIFVPVLDPAPFKSPGWLSALSGIQIIFILFFCAAVISYVLMRLFQKNKAAAYLCCSAILLIIFHATIATIADPTPGSILSNRYLAPGAALILMTLATLIIDARPTPGPGVLANIHQDLRKIVPARRKAADSTNVRQGAATRLGRFCVSPALLVSFMLLQSLILWTDSRMSWESDLTLWQSAWNHGSRSKMVAENYAAIYNNAGNFQASRDIAQSWIDHNPDAPMNGDLCKIYLTVLEADVNLKDQENGVRHASRAVPIGTCHFRLTGDITFFLMKTQCKQVLPMIYQMIARGDNTTGVGTHRFKTSDQRKKLLLDAAYGEFRCGSRSKATGLLGEVAQTDRSWAVDGTNAQTLEQSATNHP